MLNETTFLTAAIFKGLGMHNILQSCSHQQLGGPSVSVQCCKAAPTIQLLLPASGVTYVEPGTFLTRLHLQHSPSWDVLPKPLHSPSSTGFVRGNASISGALTQADVVSSYSPASVRSSHLSPDLLLLSMNIPFWKSFSHLLFFGQLFSHLSQTRGMQCLFRTPAHQDAVHFRADVQVP